MMESERFVVGYSALCLRFPAGGQERADSSNSFVFQLCAVSVRLFGQQCNANWIA